MSYDEEGFLRLGAVLDADDIARLRAALDALLGADPARSEYGVLRHDVRRGAPAFEDALAALAARAAALGPWEELVLFQDNLIWKPPGTGEGIAWHQDFAYWPLSAPDGITLWLALDDATEENGCLAYIPGTHRDGERRPTAFTTGERDPDGHEALPLLDARAREGERVLALARAGEALAHHPLVWHGSAPNRSATHRRAWSVTLVAPHVLYDASHAPHPFNYELGLARGAPLPEDRFPRLRGRRASSVRASKV